MIRVGKAILMNPPGGNKVDPSCEAMLSIRRILALSRRRSQGMKELKVVFLIVLCSSSLLFSQVDERLKDDIRRTGAIHSPLPLDYSKSFETFGLTKKVLSSHVLCDMED